MGRSFAKRNSSRRLIALAVVAVMHAFAVYALTTSLGRKAVEVVKKPVKVAVMEEIKPTPPPPTPTPPPKVVPQTEVPRPRSAPPPPFVPTPEVTPPPATVEPVISTVTNIPPVEPPVIAPPPPAPPPAPAPVAAAAARGDEISVACPSQVKPEIPREALQHGMSGVVKARIVVNAGVVRSITIVSGPREFHSAVRAAIRQYKCISSGGDVVAEQEFSFKVE